MTDFLLTAPPIDLGQTAESRGETWRRRASARLAKMHQRYGRRDGQVCRDCVFLLRMRPNRKTFLKCEKAGVSASDATDWRAKWTACGAFEPEPEPR